MEQEQKQPLSLSASIEAVLFWRSEPTTTKELSKLLKVKESEIVAALEELHHTLSLRGIALVRGGDSAALGTAPAMAALIETLTKEELSRDLGKAGLETLSIIMYKGPVSRREIDYIRGVNSTFIIRNLMIRGLIERVEEGKDGRSFRYRATISLLSFMGVARVEDLPEFAKVHGELEAFERSKDTQAEQETKPATENNEAQVAEISTDEIEMPESEQRPGAETVPEQAPNM